MGLRDIAHTVHTLATGILLVGAGAVSAAAAESEGANVRITQYKADSGEAYFAASIQPSADDALLGAVSDPAADVVVVVDTSASQVGPFRSDSLAAVQSLLAELGEEDRVRLYAGDVRASDLSDAFHRPSASATSVAVAKLNERLPLGNTNLVSVLDTVRASLVGQPSGRTRSIVYIGDGASIDSTQDRRRFEGLVEALRADRIAVHSMAVGPSTNIELMGILANQTGGTVATAGSEDQAASAVARQVADSATTSPIWLSDARLLDGMRSVQADRLPPLRLDRDTILLGQFDPSTSSGTIQLTGETPDATVRVVADASVEPSHPDFAFLPGLVDDARPDGGLMLASAGSGMLRQTARMMAARSEELSRAGNLALKQGNRRGAEAVADMALKADPNNPEAQAVKRVAAGDRLVAQNASQNDGQAAAEQANQDGGSEPAVQPPPEPAPQQVPNLFDSSAVPPAGDGLLEPGGELLERVEAERGAAAGRLRAEVRAQLREARRQLREDPTGVAGQLKSLLAMVETTPDIDPALRQELVGQVRTAIQIASRREAEYAEAQANAQELAAGAAASARLLEATFRREARLQALSQQLNSLIDEGRYAEADGEVSLEIASLAGDEITEDSVAGRHFTDETLMLQVYDRDRRYKEMRDRNFVDAFSLNLKASIPFVDEPPIMYPDAEVWQRLSRRRIERYGAIELVGDNETERRIQRSLDDEVSYNFIETPLQDAVRQISEAQEVPIIVDTRALEEVGLTADSPVSITLQNVSLRSVLRLMLRELDLTYMIKDEVLQITTPEAAETNLVNKVYPVGDLVVPIIQMGGGGMGGGGMGGGMGGGGMGGGGAFAVPDDVSLQDKTTTVVPTDKAAGAEKTSGPSAEADQAASAAKTDATGSKSVMAGPQPIRVEPAEGQSRGEAWREFYAEAKIESVEELTKLDRRVRATVGQLNAKASSAQKAGDEAEAIEHFSEIRHAIAGAIAAGHVQPWMYRAYAIALQATEAPAEQVERALLSAVDFAETPEDVLNVAGRLEEIGSNAAALRLCRNVSAMDAYRREPYVMGLRLAKRLDDLEGLTWACQGVLSQAWPEEFQAVVADARLVARATHEELVESGQQEKADALHAALQEAASHDVIVRVSWTGEADIDLAVEEPSGTVCSLENRSTAGGGTLLGDSYPGVGEDESGAVSETYLCPEGFSGQYRLLLRRVWGNVSTGHATVEILTDVGRPSQRFIRKEVPLTEKNALAIFEVQEGTRKQEVGQAQLAHLRDVQRDVRENLLGQAAGDPRRRAGAGRRFLGGSDPESYREYVRDLRALGGGLGGNGFGNNGFFGGNQVGFRPEITVLPEGAMLLGLAIISADRRYVRITPTPFFSQIGEVNTFNFVTGDDGGGGGGGGIGGGGGGLGGGGGGLGN